MNGTKRREKILATLVDETQPVSGTALAEKFHVSRQVIVQDIALLRATDENIVSTARGYVMFADEEKRMRRFKVRHDLMKMEEELNIFVDCGVTVRDVVVEHPVYGELRGSLNLSSRRDVKLFMKKIHEHPDAPLMNTNQGVHYHTVEASGKDVLDEVEEALREGGFLVES